MTVNTSATGGALPVPAGMTTEALEDLLHDLVTVLTGLPGTLVRPRYQTKPPPQPDAGTDWCALAIAEQASDGAQLIAGDDQAVLRTSETITVEVSFYGPAGATLAKRLRRGLSVAQNRVSLRAAGVAFVEAGPIVPAADLVGSRWVRRFDLTLTFRRGEDAVLPIGTLLCGRPILVPSH